MNFEKTQLCVPTPAKQSEITFALGELDSQIGKLGALLESLKGRLYPIMMPSAPKLAENQANCVSPRHGSEIGGVISSFTDRVKNAQVEIQDTLERLGI